ncbi:heavy metal translocating P-type ATPase [Nocardiopsis sediminis]|uniref:Heavy metal translocating P-type ATPase n=1 Tax=Nocardiopsis sediminis TaxID=1778267 RepID=A0ABV8FNA6_9ACTN
MTTHAPAFPIPPWASARVLGAGLSVAGLGLGAVLRLSVGPPAGDIAWLCTTVVGAGPALWWVLQGLWHRQYGSDAIALLALVGTIVVHEYLAGAIISVMLLGGRLLEERASRRARADLGALLARSPKVAHRRSDGSLETVAAEDVAIGDRLVVRTGEIVPVDGRVDEGTASLDESAVTGEPLPVAAHVGDDVRSGVVNLGAPFSLRATATAGDSTYAGIIRLVREAESQSAPFVRLADRYATVFLPVTVVVAAAAWALSHDLVRAVAVLVVATPCPLILAAPIAFTAGMSRCARRGVIVRNGDALERLARARVLLFDKTGTVTAGRPRLFRSVSADDALAEAEVLGYAASLDQMSDHVLAASVVAAARDRGLALEMPADVREEGGRGVEGTVAGRLVRIGKAQWVARRPPSTWVEAVQSEARRSQALTVFVGVDERLVGVLLLRDPLRDDAPRTFRLLRRSGMERMVMITGDRRSTALVMAAYVGVGAEDVMADRSPQDKLAVVAAESESSPTMMVGDGINDAPALARAGVGVALGARGASAASESADVVIAVDRLDRVAEARSIAQRTRRLAAQSALAGIGLSVLAMAVAAAGQLAPTAGALLQEVIDLTVIVNALRALFAPGHRARLQGDTAELARGLDEDHRRLWPRIDELPHAADRIRNAPRAALVAALDDLEAFCDELVRHETADERRLYPAVDRALRCTSATEIMSRAHAEILATVRRTQEAVGELRADASAGARDSASYLLVELHALLRLHFVQEEESFHVLAGDGPASSGRAGR